MPSGASSDARRSVHGRLFLLETCKVEDEGNVYTIFSDQCSENAEFAYEIYL